MNQMSNKRKRDGKELNPDERAIHSVIKGKGNMGISKFELGKEVKMLPTKFNSSIKSLQTKKMIKLVEDINKKGTKLFMASEFEPSEILTGGAWYENGKLDTQLIDTLKRVSLKAISDQKVATIDGVLNYIKRSGIMNVDPNVEQVQEILENLILDDKIVKVKSNGLGEFTAFPSGVDCYKIKRRGEKIGAMASIPCGVCPRINQCTPGGLISPTTCVYYEKWLEF